MLLRAVVLFAVGFASLPAFAQSAKPAGKASDVVTYKDHVAPLLRKHCVNCHNPDKATSDLNVTTYQSLMAGGSSGNAIAPGNPDQSLLYRVVAHLDEPYMPPKQARISDADLAVIKKWIELGAPETSTSAAKGADRKLDLDAGMVSTGKPKGPPPMPEGPYPAMTAAHTVRAPAVTALAASPWAPLLAVSGYERILLYNTDTLNLLGALPFPEHALHVLRFSRNGKMLLAAGGHAAAAGRVVLFDVGSGRRVTEIGDELDVVLAADFSPNHKSVALGGPSKVLKIYDTESGELRHRIKKHTDWVTALEFSPDGEFLASGDRNGGAFIWEAAAGTLVFTLGDHKDAITQLSWRADSQMLATASEDGRVILWYAEDGFPTRTINATVDGSAKPSSPRNKVLGVMAVVYAHGGMLATTGRDTTARLWKADGNQLVKFEGFADVPTRIVFSHDEKRVFAGDFTGKVQVWDVKTTERVGELSTNPPVGDATQSAAALPAGKH